MQGKHLHLSTSTPPRRRDIKKKLNVIRRDRFAPSLDLEGGT